MLLKRTRKKKKIALIQGSLSPYSKTAVLIHEAAACFKRKAIDHEILDLRALDIDIHDHHLPVAQYTPDTQKAYAVMRQADAYLCAVPVYAHSVSGAVKNMIALAAPVMKKKPVGILCYSGSTHSYVASLDFIKFLSKTAHSIILKPIIHTYVEDFQGDSIYTESIYQLIEELTDCAIRHS